MRDLVWKRQKNGDYHLVSKTGGLTAVIQPAYRWLRKSERVWLWFILRSGRDAKGWQFGLRNAQAKAEAALQGGPHA